MASAGRRSTAAEGQLLREFRGRVLSGLPSDRIAALAALIDSIGEPCWAAGPTAAAVHGFDGFRLRPPFHVVVPRGRNVRRIGHVVHTTDDVDRIDFEIAEGLPVTAPPRTLFDLARFADRSELTTALDSMLRDGGATEDFLHRRIAALRSQGKHGVPRLLEAIEGAEIHRGGHSWLEREFLRLMSIAGVPRPDSQQVLGRRGDRMIRVDFHFPGTPVVVETLGYRWHRTGAQMSVDAERANRLTLAGFVVLQFTYHQVVDQPGVVIATVRAALEGFPGGLCVSA